MATSRIAAIKIHPAIGIARLGNSPDEFFIGPESPGVHARPRGGFRDSHGRIKRQAARFRLFAYDHKGKVLGEITAADAQIEWTVHLANTKAEWKQFDGLKSQRGAPQLGRRGPRFTHHRSRCANHHRTQPSRSIRYRQISRHGCEAGGNPLGRQGPSCGAGGNRTIVVSHRQTVDRLCQ